MTKELREKLVKMAKSHAERTKVGIRRVRQKSISEARRSKDDVSEDTVYRIEKHVSNHTYSQYISIMDSVRSSRGSLGVLLVIHHRKMNLYYLYGDFIKKREPKGS